MKDHPSVLPWWLSWPLVLFIECLGLVSCGIVGGSTPKANVVTTSGARVELVTLSDGTVCAILADPNLHTGGITCNWKQ